MKKKIPTQYALVTGLSPLSTCVEIIWLSCDNRTQEHHSIPISLAPAAIGDILQIETTVKGHRWYYLDSFKIVKYTDPASVHEIMDAYGTRGVLNTDTGLMLNGVLFQKGTIFALKNGVALRIPTEYESAVREAENF